MLILSLAPITRPLCAGLPPRAAKAALAILSVMPAAPAVLRKPRRSTGPELFVDSLLADMADLKFPTRLRVYPEASGPRKRCLPWSATRRHPGLAVRGQMLQDQVRCFDGAGDQGRGGLRFLRQRRD